MQFYSVFTLLYLSKTQNPEVRVIIITLCVSNVTTHFLKKPLKNFVTKNKKLNVGFLLFLLGQRFITKIWRLLRGHIFSANPYIGIPKFKRSQEIHDCYSFVWNLLGIFSSFSAFRLQNELSIIQNWHTGGLRGYCCHRIKN